MCINIGGNSINLSLFTFNLNLDLNKKANENGKPVLIFTYDKNLNMQNLSTISKRKLKKEFEAWYRLLPDQDFDVRVYDKYSKECSKEKSMAIKMFLQDVVNKGATDATVSNYARSYEMLKEVVDKLHLEKAADSVKEKYSKLYYCLMIIDKILAPRLAEPKKGNEFFKAFIPSAGDFHFTIELNTKELKEILSDDELDRLKNTTSDCIALGNKIKVERVLPEMYLHIAYSDEKILQKYPKIRNVDEYYVCKD